MSQSPTVEVQAEEAGQRLDRLLADRLEISRARVRHLLEVGRVRAGDRVLGLSDKSHAAAEGEVFTLDGALRADEERIEPRPDLPLDVAESGPGWVIVEKPAGVGVHPLRPDQTDTVLNALVARHPEIEGVGEGGLRSGVVHRLDVGTTGALVFATDAETWRRLRGAFSTHRVEKRYEALLEGRFEQPKRVSFPLEVVRHEPAHVAVREGGRKARQHVAPLEIGEHATLVEVRLETGFLHQIRATMAHLGHPVVGDREYGSQMEGAERPMLHARSLRFEEIQGHVELPADFRAALSAQGIDAV